MNLPLPPFATIADRVREHARTQSQHPALVCHGETWTYAQLDTFADSVAAQLQREGGHEVVVICAGMSLEYVGVFLGALRAGVAVAPLPPSATPEQLRGMVHDTAARLVFDDDRLSTIDAWRAINHKPAPVEVPPEATFNIIYSSGTTGAPKGIAQSHARRWQHTQALAALGATKESVAMVATPLYSNTTLVVLFPMLAIGGTCVLLPKFDAAAYLALAQQHRATLTMLVPVQYQRILAATQFDAHDLSSFRLKICTGAPASPQLKAEILQRWSGGLVELYGSTEGACGCVLMAHEHPDKLHTVGRPVRGCELRVIDEAGNELPVGVAGELVGHAATMMAGYHKQPVNDALEWRDADGKRFLRTGDIGYLDADGFVVLVDRKKDMIITGGFNVYPADIEAVLREHLDVADVAVVGMPSERWGETPVACVVAKSGGADPGQIREWANARLGKTQRVAQVHLMQELPRSAVGKLLKRELRERLLA